MRGGGSVAVVGGSIAGCAFASVAVRAGAERVVVLERTGGRLADRGFGLCIHDDRAAELVAAGTLPPGIAAHALTRRRWVVRDGDSAAGTLFWEQPFPFHSYHWGLLWQGLRAATPESVVYRQGAAVTDVTGTAADGLGASPGLEDASRPKGAPTAPRSDAERPEVRCADGTAEQHDLVIGADGYRSVAREAVAAGSRPQYAGYVCWRGHFDTRRMDGLGRDGLGKVGLGTGRTDRDPLGEEVWPADAVTTVCFPGGSCVIYRIPGPAGTRVNWVLYAVPPQDGTLRFDDPTSFPPGHVTPGLAAGLSELLDREFPPYWGRLLALTPPEDTFVQPIYDLQTPRVAAGRVLLAGDAASVVRPHNTSGVAKALQDATAFGAAWRAAPSWDDLVSHYQAARGPAGGELVALARRLGHAQVERTPDWAAMTPGRAERWWRDVLAGEAGIGGRSLGGG